MTLADSEQALLRELHAGLEVLKSQQSEINRRLGKIEGRLDGDLVDPKRVEALEETLEEKRGWWKWILQSIGYIVVATALVTIGKSMGLEVAW